MMNVLKKCQDLATYLHKSNVAPALLSQECSQVGHSPTVVMQSNDTRWDSQEACMNSVIAHQTCLENLARRGEERFPELVPTITDFILMKGACENLKRCKITTKIFEQEKVPTINLVVDRIFTMVEELDTFIKDKNNRGSGVMFARHLKTQLEKRFPGYATDRDLNCFANYLDPVIKGLHLKAVNKFDITINKLESMVDEESQSIPEENNNVGEDEPLKPLTPREKLKKKILEKESSQLNQREPIYFSKFRKECATYESMPDADNTTDRLMWWSSHSESFPILSRLARKILAVPAASSKSERVFSVAGNTVTPKRGSMSPVTVEALVTVACNLRLLKEMGLVNLDREDEPMDSMDVIEDVE